MIITFEHNRKKYVNFDLSDEKVVEQLKSLGVDVETLAKKEQKKNLSEATDSYIQRKLQEIDEDLADLVSEKSWLEGVFDAHGISPEQVRKETVLVILGKKTIDEAISELSIPDDLVSDFQRAVEIARIIAWKEAVWKAEAKLEEQVDSMSLEELLQLDVKRLCEDTYSKIPLEV
jgi:ribosomal protein L12E/L44/L45/RPP1/RPP2